MHKPLPKELIESLRGINGFDEAGFLQVHESGEQLTSIRYNPEKLDHQLSNYPVPWCRYGCYLPERPSFTLDPHFHAGKYYVQEASSMFLWQVLEQIIGTATAGLKVLDLCAAPGGKSTLLASYFRDGVVVANELIKSRANVLVENITKWGTDNVIVTNNAPLDFTRLQGYFDVMVIDAPCSGSGLFRKDNAAISEWSIEAVKGCSTRQQRIVGDIYPALKKGGLLIYSTCSYSKEENEDILDTIKEKMAVDSCRLVVDDHLHIAEAVSDKTKAYGYRFFPDKLQGEGFFIAAFRKNDGEDFMASKGDIALASREEKSVAAAWVNNNKALSFFKQKNYIIAAGEEWIDDISLLQKNLYLRKAGICMGEIKGKDFIPGHELAVSLLLAGNIAPVSLNREQAIDYLKKKEITAVTTIKGWALAKFEGSHLGWMKVLGNRINNYYPKEWRILKQ